MGWEGGGGGRGGGREGGGGGRGKGFHSSVTLLHNSTKTRMHTKSTLCVKQISPFISREILKFGQYIRVMRRRYEVV